MFVLGLDIQFIHFQSNCHRYEMSQWTKHPADIVFGSKCSVDTLWVDFQTRHPVYHGEGLLAEQGHGDLAHVAGGRILQEPRCTMHGHPGEQLLHQHALLHETVIFGGRKNRKPPPFLSTPTPQHWGVLGVCHQILFACSSWWWPDLLGTVAYRPEDGLITEHDILPVLLTLGPMLLTERHSLPHNLLNEEGLFGSAAQGIPSLMSWMVQTEICNQPAITFFSAFAVLMGWAVRWQQSLFSWAAGVILGWPDLFLGSVGVWCTGRGGPVLAAIPFFAVFAFLCSLSVISFGVTPSQKHSIIFVLFFHRKGIRFIFYNLWWNYEKLSVFILPVQLFCWYSTHSVQVLHN